MIEVEGLTKQYKSVRAVDDLTFKVEPGIVTGFLGPNGAVGLTVNTGLARRGAIQA